MRKSLFTFLCLAVLQAAFSQTPDSVIISRRDTLLLDETIVRAFEANNPAKNIAASITTLSRQVIDRFPGTSLVAAMATAPGVKMDERSPGSYRLSIRGNLLRSTFGIRNVKVYWNGIPFTDASGNTYLNLLPARVIDQVEIIRGPSGSMYGSGTGGVLLLSSDKSNQRPAKEIEMQLSAGSRGLRTGDISFGKSGNTNYVVTFSHQQADGYRMHSEMRRDMLHYVANTVLTARYKLSVNLFAADLFYETPGALTMAELNRDPKMARPAAGIFQSAVSQKAAVYLKTMYGGLSLQSRLNEQWSNTSSLYGSYTDFRNPTIRNYENKYDRGTGARTLFQYKKDFFKGVFGAEYQTGFFYGAVHGNQKGTKDTLQFQDDVTSKQLNVFAQADLELPANFSFSTGVSYNRFAYGYQRAAAVQKDEVSSSFSPQVIPRFSLLKKVGRVNLYAAVSKGYSVPSIDEVHAGNDVFNTNLNSEIAWNYEAGVKASLLPAKLWLDASFYIFQLRNTIVSRRDAGGGDFYTNAGKTKQQGTEVALRYVPLNRAGGFWRQVKINSAYTNTNAKFRNYQQGLNVFNGNKLTGTAPNMFNFGLDVFTAHQLSLNMNYSYVDHIPLNDANTYWANSYQLIYGRLNYGCNLTAQLTGMLFVAYESSLHSPYSLGNDLNAAGNRFFNPAAPEQFTVGIKTGYRLRQRRANAL